MKQESLNIITKLLKHDSSKPFMLDIEKFYDFKTDVEIARSEILSEKDGRFELDCWGRVYTFQIKPRKTVLNRLKRWWVYLTT